MYQQFDVGIFKIMKTNTVYVIAQHHKLVFVNDSCCTKFGALFETVFHCFCCMLTNQLDTLHLFLPIENCVLRKDPTTMG